MVDGATYEAARRGTAVADLGARRARLVVTGRHRRKFLHNLTSADVNGLHAGERGEATLLSPEGKLAFHFFVYDRGEDHLVECAAAAGDRLLEAFDRYIIADDVRLRRADPHDLPQWAALGPGAGAFVRDALGLAPDAPLPADERTCVPGGAGAIVASARTVLGAAGLVVVGAPFPDALVNTTGHPRLDDGALEVLRVEGGIPAPDAEIDGRLLPQEAGLDRALSFTKGCYVGQEAVAMLHYRGKLRRRAVGLVLEASTTASTCAGARVIAAGGDEVGRVTSGAVFSPSLGAPVALAVLKAPAHEPGTAVEIAAPEGDRRWPATVRSLPLVE